MEHVIGAVLVPLDGSSLAEAALPVGQRLAVRLDCPLHLVRVIDADVSAETERRAQQALWDAARRAGAQAHLHLRVGEAADQILAEAANLRQPLVVMTTHGRSGLGRWAFGSVADRVVRGGEAPVLLLRSGVTAPESVGFERLLVPLDGSALAKDALPYAVALARLYGAELHLVRVAETTHLFMVMGVDAAPMPADVMNQMIADLVGEAQAYLEPVVARMRGDGLTVVSAVVDGIPAEALLGYATSHGIDLVVLATHGRGGFNRLVLGSVAERLLRLAPIPILMVPAAAVAEVPVTDERQGSAR